MADEIQADASVEAQESSEVSESNENLESQESEASGESQPTAEEVQAAVEKLISFKANGKEMKFNLNDEKQLEQLIKMAQKGDGAEAKMQKAAELEKAYEMFQKKLETDFDSVLKERGIDPDEWAEKRIEAAIERAKKSPEELEREKERQELEELRKQMREREDKEKQAAEEAELQKTQNEIIAQIDKALDSHKELPKEPNIRARIASAMLHAQDLGYKDITPEDVIPIVKREMNQEFLKVLENLPDDVIEQWIGSKTVEKLKKRKVAPKLPPKLDTKDTGAVRETEEDKTKKRIKARDFFKNL